MTFLYTYVSIHEHPLSMRENVTFFLAGLLTTALLAAKVEPADKSLARVEKKTGKLVFMECEPVAEYEVAFRFSIPLAGVEQLSDFPERSIKKATKISEKEHKDFDAIVIKSGQREDIAIKFK